MADGVPYTSDATVTVATDYCGSAGHVELIKLAVSTDGDATPIPGDPTYGLAVDVKRLTGSLSVSGAVSITGLSAVSLIGTGIAYSIPVGTHLVSGNVNILNTVVTSQIGTGAVIAYQAGTVPISGNVNLLAQKGADNFAVNQATINVSGVLIVAARANRRGVSIVVHGTTDVYLGGAGVTASTGLKLKGIDGNSVFIATTAAITGIVGSATQAVSFMELYD